MKNLVEKKKVMRKKLKMKMIQPVQSQMRLKRKKRKKPLGIKETNKIQPGKISWNGMIQHYPTRVFSFLSLFV